MTAANEKPVTESLEALIERMRLLETDHTPDGWPAVRMRDITALCDEIERRFGIGSELIAARRELDDLRAEIARRAQPAEAVDEAKEREAFEKWWDNCSLPKVDEGYYGQLEDCWQAWLARARGGR